MLSTVPGCIGFCSLVSVCLQEENKKLQVAEKEKN